MADAGLPTQLEGFHPVNTGSEPGDHSGVAANNHRETLRIASFNIQVFGTSKSRKPQVMDLLARVVRCFDVVAIQELRTTDPAVMENFVRLINQAGSHYGSIVGPRLGRTVSKEQYVFVYDTQRLRVIPNTVLTLEDPEDLLHREPMIAQFQTLTRGADQPFSFILINVHTDPDETRTELDALGEAFVAVQQNPWHEDDIILLGDLNVDYTKLGTLGRLPDIACTVRGEPTNTRGSKSYDNIVFNQVATVEFTGTAAVLDLKETYGLTMEQALEVSDHMPVWAEFSMFEGGARPQLARRNVEPQGQPITQSIPIGQGTLITPDNPSHPTWQQSRARGLRGMLDRAQEETEELRSKLPLFR
jgi:endonuclease/exonuclease/phosphatase family metal-dependent hydrolase